jgi:hypothetical protein
MNKELLNYNLIKISEKLTTDQILYARKNRDWNKFDSLNEFERLIHCLEEFEIYQDYLSDLNDNDSDI